MAEQWVKDAQFEARLADYIYIETNKSLATVKQKNKELTLKLDAKDRGRKSVEATLKNAQAQAEEQHKKHHYTEIELAMANQQVEDLKAELEKAKEAVWVAQAATDASGQ